MLVGTADEISLFLNIILRIDDTRFIENFLRLTDNRASMMHFREYVAAYRFFMEQGFENESMEHADNLVVQWMVFHEAEASYNLLECIQLMRSDEYLQAITDPDTKYVAIFASVHRYRREHGVYEAVNRYGNNVADIVKPHLKG